VGLVPRPAPRQDPSHKPNAILRETALRLASLEDLVVGYLPFLGWLVDREVNQVDGSLHLAVVRHSETHEDGRRPAHRWIAGGESRLITHLLLYGQGGTWEHQ